MLERATDGVSLLCYFERHFNPKMRHKAAEKLRWGDKGGGGGRDALTCDQNKRGEKGGEGGRA